jgi:hypothetical protein
MSDKYIHTYRRRKGEETRGREGGREGEGERERREIYFILMKTVGQ